MRKLLNYFDKSVDACVVTDACEVKQLGAYRNAIKALEGNTPTSFKMFHRFNFTRQYSIGILCTYTVYEYLFNVTSVFVASVRF